MFALFRFLRIRGKFAQKIVFILGFPPMVPPMMFPPRPGFPPFVPGMPPGYPIPGVVPGMAPVIPPVAAAEVSLFSTDSYIMFYVTFLLRLAVLAF